MRRQPLEPQRHRVNKTRRRCCTTVFCSTDQLEQGVLLLVAQHKVCEVRVLRVDIAAAWHADRLAVHEQIDVNHGVHTRVQVHVCRWKEGWEGKGETEAGNE